MYVKCVILLFILTALPLRGYWSLAVHPGLHVLNDQTGYGGSIMLDYSLADIRESAFFLRGAAGIFHARQNDFSYLASLAAGGAGYKILLADNPALFLSASFLAGISMNRRQKDQHITEWRAAFSALGSIGLEYSITEKIAVGLSALPLYTATPEYRAISIGACLALSFRLSTPVKTMATLADDVRKKREFARNIYSDDSQTRIELPESSFSPGSHELTKEAHQTLKDLAIQLDGYPVHKILIEGHTDNSGDPQNNLELSSKRAEAVATVMLDNSISAPLISAIGHGQTRPRYPNDNDANRARNRRVEIVIFHDRGE